MKFPVACMIDHIDYTFSHKNRAAKQPFFIWAILKAMKNNKKNYQIACRNIRCDVLR